MRRSYLDYAMSVIVSRASPTCATASKPVHRRILYAMHETGNTHDKPYRKSRPPRRRRHGSVPPARRRRDLRRAGAHGAGLLDAPDAARRAGQLRLDGRRRRRRPCATPRCGWPSRRRRCWRTSTSDTVDFVPNYDGNDREPVVLPARFPNLLVNGAGGIAVGMATNIPPHNLGEVIDATLALIENPELDDRRPDRVRPRPRLPDGRRSSSAAPARCKAYMTGRGCVIVRAKTHVEEIRKDRWAIIVDEVPYQVNKATMIKKHRRARPREADRGHRPRPGRVRPASACAWSSS